MSMYTDIDRLPVTRGPSVMGHFTETERYIKRCLRGTLSLTLLSLQRKLNVVMLTEAIEEAGCDYVLRNTLLASLQQSVLQHTSGVKLPLQLQRCNA